MNKLIFPLMVVLFTGFALAQDCEVDLEMRLVPSGTDADLRATYNIDCYSDTYEGQVNNFRLNLKTGKAIAVSDSAGTLQAEINDPDYFKLTKMEAYYLLSVRPRKGIVIGPFGNEYGLTVSYPGNNILTPVDDNTKFVPSEVVLQPKLMVQKGNTQTLVDVTVDTYTFIVELPDGSELKESSVPCTVSQGTLECEIGAGAIDGVAIMWREKPLAEQIAKKGTPWVLTGIKAFLGKYLGGII